MLRVCCIHCDDSYSYFFFFFFKQKTAYEMRISDWSSDLCSSDLLEPVAFERHAREPVRLELLGETAQPPVERPCPLLQIGGRIGLEWQAVGHLIGIASTQQIGVEAAIIAGSFDPYVAGAQPIAQRGHDGRLVSPARDLATLAEEALPPQSGRAPGRE